MSAVAVDVSGNAYVTGHSSSSTFIGEPSGGAQTTNPGLDGFVAKLNPTATALLYFTFLNGDPNSIVVDFGLNAYVGGAALPGSSATAGVVQINPGGGEDGFVAKLNAAGSAFSYFTYLGGPGDDSVTSIAVDPASGELYVTGQTSGNFPLVSPVQGTPPGAGTLFQTGNYGGSWTAIDNQLPTVQSVSPDPANPATIVASTETGIYRTTNTGGSWARVAAIESPNLMRSPADPNTIYAIDYLQDYRSTDGGITWATRGSAPGYYPLIIPDPITASTAYTYTGAAILKTTDGGTTWNVTPSVGSRRRRFDGRCAGWNSVCGYFRVRGLPKHGPGAVLDGVERIAPADRSIVDALGVSRLAGRTERPLWAVY